MAYRMTQSSCMAQYNYTVRFVHWQQAVQFLGENLANSLREHSITQTKKDGHNITWWHMQLVYEVSGT